LLVFLLNSYLKVSSDFFNRNQVSFLSFGIYFTESISNRIYDRDEGEYHEEFVDEIICINADLVSDNTTQDGIRVINMFRFMRKQPFFDKLKNKNKLILWCDSGTHFKNKELMHYLFVELKAEGVRVEWNLFQDKHGLLKITIFKII